jgi:LDH2 family malate/lactate/ureidoglycolate dehydrogenase
MINNMLSLVLLQINWSAAMPLARQVAALEAWLKASPLQPGSSGIHLPGEPGGTARERQRDGIPLARRTCEALAVAPAISVSATRIFYPTAEYSMIHLHQSQQRRLSDSAATR